MRSPFALVIAALGAVVGLGYFAYTLTKSDDEGGESESAPKQEASPTPQTAPTPTPVRAPPVAKAEAEPPAASDEGVPSTDSHLFAFEMTAAGLVRRTAARGARFAPASRHPLEMTSVGLVRRSS